MLAYAGPAVLERQANPSLVFTCDVTALVEEIDAGWSVVLTPAVAGESAMVEMLTNPWHLRFPDGSVFEVDLRRIADEARWLAEAAASPS